MLAGYRAAPQAGILGMSGGMTHGTNVYKIKLTMHMGENRVPKGKGSGFVQGGVRGKWGSHSFHFGLDWSRSCSLWSDLPLGVRGGAPGLFFLRAGQA